MFAAVALVGLALDVLTKAIAVDRLEPLVPVRLLGGLLELRLIRNSGAAFSSGERFTAVFAVAACLVLVFVLLKLVPRLGHPAWAVALGLLCAGVAGNLVDRIFRAPGVLRGHVVDFLELPHWPIFNVADMCITSAAVLIMVLSVIKNVGIGGERYVRTPTTRPEPVEGLEEVAPISTADGQATARPAPVVGPETPRLEPVEGQETARPELVEGLEEVAPISTADEAARDERDRG